MVYRILICGVGGQGILSTANIIARSAAEEGLFIRQSEIHGMSQRGGAVYASISLSKEPISLGDIIPTGSADMILSMEPLESLRYLDKLAKEGILITADKPFENIPDYPELTIIYEEIHSLPKSILVDTAALAKEAGSAHTGNVVLIGAASKYFPISHSNIIGTIKKMFSHKGEKIIEANIKALQLGQRYDLLRETAAIV